MFLFTVLRRAFASNLQTIRCNALEHEKLLASGVEHATVQDYFAWRRSVLTFVVLCTAVATAIATYQSWTDTSERPDVLSVIEAHLTDSFSSDDGSMQDSEVNADQGNDDDEEEQDYTTTFGYVTELIQWVSWYSLPLTALIAVMFWTQFRLTHLLLAIAFTFSFLFPMLLALCPWSWTYVEPNDPTMTAVEKQAESIAYGMAYGAEYLITLLPSVLSLIPGVQRACLRIKTLLPQSILPGWFLVAASPFYALVLLMVFVAISQIASNPFFFIGMFLLLTAPLLYVVRADVVTEPLKTTDQFQSLRRVQMLVGATTAVAGVQLLIFFLGLELRGVRLLGTNPDSSLVQPIDAIQLILETIGKSMFVTVLGSDILMRMNLKAWKNSDSFAGSGEAKAFDNTMQQMEKAMTAS